MYFTEQYYSPTLADTNRDFWKGVLKGEKKLIKNKDICVITVPKLPGLGVKNIMAQFKNIPKIL